MTEQEAVAVLAAIKGFVRILINQGKSPEQAVDYIRTEVGLSVTKQWRKNYE